MKVNYMEILGNKIIGHQLFLMKDEYWPDSFISHWDNKYDNSMAKEDVITTTNQTFFSKQYLPIQRSSRDKEITQLILLPVKIVKPEPINMNKIGYQNTWFPNANAATKINEVSEDSWITEERNNLNKERIENFNILAIAEIFNDLSLIIFYAKNNNYFKAYNWTRFALDSMLRYVDMKSILPMSKMGKNNELDIITKKIYQVQNWTKYENDVVLDFINYLTILTNKFNSKFNLNKLVEELCERAPELFSVLSKNDFDF